MKQALEEDYQLFQAYTVASWLKIPVYQVYKMTVEELNGWIAYDKMTKGAWRGIW